MCAICFSSKPKFPRFGAKELNSGREVANVAQNEPGSLRRNAGNGRRSAAGLPTQRRSESPSLLKVPNTYPPTLMSSLAKRFTLTSVAFISPSSSNQTNQRLGLLDPPCGKGFRLAVVSGVGFARSFVVLVYEMLVGSRVAHLGAGGGVRADVLMQMRTRPAPEGLHNPASHSCVSRAQTRP